MHKEQLLDNLIDGIIEGHPVEGDQPLAEVAARLARLSELRPRPEAKDDARRLMLAAAARKSRKRSRTWLGRKLTAVLASGMALTLATSGTVYAASNSLPGDLLYPVKEATENVELIFTPSGQARAEAQVRLARIRLAEIKALMRRKDKRRIGLLVSALNRRLALARAEGGLTPGEVRRIKAAADSLRTSTKRWLPPGLKRRLLKDKPPAPRLIRKSLPLTIDKSATQTPSGVAPDQQKPLGTPPAEGVAPNIKPAQPILAPKPRLLKPARHIIRSILRRRLRQKQAD